MGDALSQLTAELVKAGGAREADSPEARSAIEERRESLAERLLTFAATRDLDPPPSEQLLGPVVVRGARTILAGPTGEGKTTMALWMLRSIVRREEFLGWRGAGGRVLVIDVEQGLRTIHRRLDEVGLGTEEGAYYWRIPEGLALDSERVDLEAIEAGIAEVRPDVVLADPLYKLHRGDSNDARLAGEVMRVFDAWRVKYGFALVIPMHPRKPPNTGGDFNKNEIAGSGAWIWGAEIVLGLQRKGASMSMLHFWKDRDGDLETGAKWLLRFDRRKGFERVEDSGEPEHRARDQVARALWERSPDPSTLEDIVQMTARSTGTVRRAIAELRRGGFPLIEENGSSGLRFYRAVEDPQLLRYQELAEAREDLAEALEREAAPRAPGDDSEEPF